MNTYRSKRLTRLLLTLLLSIVLIPMTSGCGKKVPKTPIELPADNGSAVISVAGTASVEQASDASSLEATASSDVVSPPAESTQPDVQQPEPDTQTETPTQEQPHTPAQEQSQPQEQTQAIDEGGIYTSKADVALYIHTYGKLPSNFITKKEAKKLGWEGGSLEDYAPGKCIGGDYFGNYEGLLPEDKEYHECDIDTLGKKKRGAKRIIYSDDGYIYYTGDHYETFELLYEP